MKKLRSLYHLTWGQRWLLLQSLLLLPVIHFCLLLFGYSRVRKACEKTFPPKYRHNMHSREEILQRAREISQIVSIAAVHGFYKATCLPRSFLVWWLLRIENMDGEICFGVRKTGNILEGHAWVEVEGNVVNDSKNVRNLYQHLESRVPSVLPGL